MAQIAMEVSFRPVFHHWRAAIVAGLIAGGVFLMFEMIMMPLVMVIYGVISVATALSIDRALPVPTSRVHRR